MSTPSSKQSRCSIVVSITACHAGDPGSIPGNGENKLFNFLIFYYPFCSVPRNEQEEHDYMNMAMEF